MPKVQTQKPQQKQLIFDKTLGQHILKNPLVINSIIEKSLLKPTDIVLEIGPGTGNVTFKILPLVKKLIVVEMDPRMASELVKRVNETPYKHKLEIIVGDFLKVELPHFDVCISNTPYQISSSLTFKLLFAKGWRSLVLMFQREFALRLVAKPGDELYCRLSVNAQLLSRIEHVVKVGRNNFIPPPKVESSVVRITPIPCSLDFDEWDGMMRILFVRKNKTVRSGFGNKILSMLEGNYKTMCSVRGEDVPMDFDIKQLVEGVLEKTQMGDKRPAKMAKDDFLALLMGFIEAGIRFSNK